MTPAKLQPALLGGVTIGVLSALPVINLPNYCCCCGWVLFGGALAAYLMQQNHPEPITAGDGAIVGLLAGVIGAFVWMMISLPLHTMLAPFQSAMTERVLRDATDMAPELRRLLEGMSSRPADLLSLGFGFIVMLFVCSVFATIGGLFGALMFRKSQPPVLPPPIPPIPPAAS